MVLCEAIIKNHSFIDGNKRAGVMAMITFLEINDYDTSKIPDDVLYDIAMGFAKGSLKREKAVLNYPYSQIGLYKSTYGVPHTYVKQNNCQNDTQLFLSQSFGQEGADKRAQDNTYYLNTQKGEI